MALQKVVVDCGMESGADAEQEMECEDAGKGEKRRQDVYATPH
jgi:hypothetical protein